MLVMSRLVCFSARLAFDLGYGVCFIGFVFGVCDLLYRLRLFCWVSGLDFVYDSLRLCCGFVCRLILLGCSFCFVWLGV